MRAGTAGWTSSTFDTGREPVEWRVSGRRVELRHCGHADEGTLNLSLAEWRALLAAAKDGQAGVIAY